MNWTIERAAEADVPSLVQLLTEATEEMSKLFQPPLGAALRSPTDIPQEAAYLARAVSDPDWALLVGRGGSGVVACGLAVVERGGDDILPSPRLTITHLAVKPGFRRRGIGFAVLAAMENWAKDRGLAALDLSVFEGNDTAAGLFEKMGYRNLEHRMGKVL